MKRYFLLAFIIHLCFIIRIDNKKTLGDREIKIKRNIPISYNIKNSKESIGQRDIISEKKEEKKVEPKQKEPEKRIEEEIKSKISRSQNKKETSQKDKLKSDKNKKITQNSKSKSIENKIPKEERKDNFIKNSNGTYTAISSKGINFKIIKEVEPTYPRQAQKIGYDKTVVVEVRFLVGLNGEVENIEILKSSKKFGFDREVIQALNRWKFEPIIYNGKKIRVYFNKEFVFTPKK